MSRGRDRGMAVSRRTVLRSLGAMGALGLLSPRQAVAAPAPPAAPALFEEIGASRSGITWVHTNAMSPQRYLPETMGPGCAFLDYDNDGWMDVFLVNSGPSDFYTPPRPLKNALFHNNRDGTFTDVTDKAGVGGTTAFGMGVAVGDYDNDGFPDIFVTAYGRPTLYHNNGDGTFTEVGKGTDIERALGKALGVVATDVNNDGRMDVFVANDTVQNFLFMNRGQGRWEEMGLVSEVGYGANGQVRSGMGVDAGDFDNDGWIDLFVANVDQEMYALYRNAHDESFTDVARANEVAQATRLMSGWGLKFFDYDNDGNLDLFLANGHPDDQVETYAGSDVQYRERPLLFHNEGGRLRNVSAEAGPIFARPLSARGLAIGDYDNDGRVDVLIGNNGDPPVLLKNNAAPAHGWVGLRLQGTSCNRDAVGARITWSAGGVTRSRLKNGGGSYLSAHDPRDVLGLGAARRADWVEVKWPLPSGRVERLEDVPSGRYLTVVEGKGIVG